MNRPLAPRPKAMLLALGLFAVATTPSGCATAPTGAPAPTVNANSLPPIRSAGDKAFGRAPVRKMSLAEVIAEIGRVDSAGAWKLSKQWEIIINSLQSSEIPALLDAVDKMHSDAPRTALRHAFFSRWGETDPAAAMARALSLPDESLRGTMRTVVLQGWAYANPAEVAAWAGQLPDGPLKTEATNTALAAGKNVESPAVVIVFPGSGNSSESPNRFSEAAALDIKAAIAEAAKLPTSFGRVQAYNAIAKVWAAKAPADAMNWALTLPDGNENGNERLVVGANIATAWTRRSPLDAHAFLAALPASSNRQSWMNDTFKIWFEHDFDGALAWAQKTADAELKQRLLNQLIDPWLKRSPDAAAEFVLSVPATHYAFTLGTEKIVALWSPNTPQAMDNFLRRMTPEQRRSQSFLFALSSWLQSAPAEALQLALDVCSGPQRIDFATRALTQLAMRDVEAAKHKIDALPEGPDRQQLIRGVLTNVTSNYPVFSPTLTKENSAFAFWLLGKIEGTTFQLDTMPSVISALARFDTNTTLTWAKALPPGPTKTSALQQVVRQMNESDPAKALNEAMTWPPGQPRNDMVAEIASRLAQKDAPRAVQLATAIEDLTLRTTAVRGVVQIMSRTNPAAALPAVMSLPVSETRGALLSEVVQNWAQSDTASATRWAEAQTTPALRAVGFGAVIAGLSNYSVADAAALLEKIPPGERLDRAVSQVCDAWCRNDPPAAARWAAALPAGNMRGLALSRVVVPFARADYLAAGAWLENLPAEPDRDRAIQAFLSLATTERAAELAPWVGKISDPEIRFAVIEMIGRLWLRSDANAANQWLSTTDLPAERRSRLRAAPADYFR